MNENHNIRRAARSSRRGFTLVELMITVAIVGVLAALAIVGYNRYVRAAASGEAKAMLQNIRGAEDVYKAESLSYLGCSGTFSAVTSYHPRSLAALDGTKANFMAGNATDDCWRQLNVRASAPVRYSYAVRAGQPGTGISETGPGADAPNWPFTGFDTVDPWFIAVAGGDYDDDGQYSFLYTSSIMTEVMVENELE